MSFEIDDNIMVALQDVGVKYDLIERKAVKAASIPVADGLQSRTPYESTSDRSWKAQRDYDKATGHKTKFKHMRDDVVVSGFDQFGHINIGWGKDTYWRVHFVELGTVNMPANPFISAAIAELQDAYVGTLEAELRKGLKL
ncbi:HK97-gp10 family putative phage morphogenesis protein [Furfurilactobacillus entadae]|uniref:HK97-gp10 family putative phage morphogenesis protein n=1 Tax=Furfurilactobacillus entadae TaxID=2922307 RepID=UPI0035E90A06